MEKETTTLRAKSPKTPKNALSMASQSGNNNNRNNPAPPRTPNNNANVSSKPNDNANPKTPKENSNPNPQPSTATSTSAATPPQNTTSTLRSKSPGPTRTITPRERSLLAREKFQSLLQSANKVSSLRAASGSNDVGVGGTANGTTTTSPTSPSNKGSIISPSSSSSPWAPPQPPSSQLSTNVNVTPTTGTTSLVTSAPATARSPSPAFKNVPRSLSPSPPPPGAGTSTARQSVTFGGGGSRATTLSTLNKSSNPSKFNQFPNIDPRTFPKPLSTTNPILVKPHLSKSIFGIDYRSKNLRAFVEKAIADHKVFSCVGVYPAIKNALKKRGWIEKTGPINVIRSITAPPSYKFEGATEDESDAAWIARNLRDYPPDFIWVIRRDNIDWKSMTKDQIINRYPKAWFTTKVGLSACLQHMHWFSEAGFSETFFPRCYRLCMDDERLAFQEDYRLTACMSYCRYFVESYEAKGANWLIDPQSRITPLSIDFASRQLGNYIRMRRHEDIDWLLPPNFSAGKKLLGNFLLKFIHDFRDFHMSQHWEAFIHQYTMVVHEKKKIRFESLEGVKMKYDVAKKTLQRIAQYWPQQHLDGVYNMWICKPGARSRGKGIVIMNSLDKIMDLLNHGNAREANWVVQKYMERPMLVYKTKFDMRQWFVITDWNPLTLWFYKESYIRFCTKPFVLEDFHESIHLCNNAIQCRYQNAESRDSALPDENMWDNYTFQAYLKTIGKFDQWAKIYNGMKQAIIGVLLASQESVDPRKGCFELYGADFMLSEDFTPWLIEINSCPCMASTTSITARMCAQALEDCIKVVIDRRNNRNAETGMFEMVYRQPLSAVTVQQFTGHDLVVHGKKLTRDIDWAGSLGSKSSHVKRASIIASNAMQVAGSNVRPPPQAMVSPQDNLTFSDLLQKLRMKNTQLFQGFVTNSQAQSLAAVAGVDTQDRTLTGTLLSKMRALSKVKEDNNSGTENDIPGMKRVYPISKPSSSRYAALKEQSTDGTLSHLSKYFEENSNTFANLVRIGKEISEEENKGKGQQPDTSEISAGAPSGSGRPLTFGPDKFGIGSRRSGVGSSTNQPGNPYLPRSETAKTLEEVRQAVNSTNTNTDKYNGKVKAVDKDDNVVILSTINLSSNDDIQKEKVDYFCNDIANVTTTANSLLINDNHPPLTNLNLAFTTNSSSPSPPTQNSGIHSSETRPFSERQIQEKFETISKFCEIKPISTPVVNQPRTYPDPPIPKEEPLLPLTSLLLDLPDPVLKPAENLIPKTLPSDDGNHNFHVQIQNILNNNLEFPSSSSTSSNSKSNSDSEFDDQDDDGRRAILNFNPALFLSPPRFQKGVADNNSKITTTKTSSSRRGRPSPLLFPATNKANGSSRSGSHLYHQGLSRSCTSRKYPCHRLSLRPCSSSSGIRNSSASSSATTTFKKSSLPTFPVSKINLKLV